MNLIRIFRSFVLVFALPTVAIASDPMGELEKFSVFSKEDIAALTQGRDPDGPGHADEHHALLVGPELLHRAQAARPGARHNEAL